MDQRTLLVEIISLSKDAREKKQSKLYLKMLPQEACTFKFKKKKHGLNSLKQNHYSLKVYNILNIGCDRVHKDFF